LPFVLAIVVAVFTPLAPRSALAAPDPRGAAQSTPERSAENDALRVFLDCNSCDFDFLRREIPFVNYVRDRKDAELHILVTTQPTGGGGTEYTFKFIGLGRFDQVDDEL
jgi:hypothetical protein